MMPDLLTLPFAEVLSDGTPIELGLVVTLIVAVGGWMGQFLLARHRIGALEIGFSKHEETHTKAHADLRAEIAELRREQRTDQADCVQRFADLQRQVDRAAASSARSGTWSRDDKP